MLKNKLLKILSLINKYEAHNEEVMKECINQKLERSLNNYESNLEDTCKYVLMRNPISMIKAIATTVKQKDAEEE